MNQHQQDIIKTLLYYDIFSYPLRLQELCTFLPTNSLRQEVIRRELLLLVGTHMIREHQGYYFLHDRETDLVDRRRQMEIRARRQWRIAELMTLIIKRFPFVRAVFVSGDLSKNVSHQESDIDFFVVTERNRLWIARSFLVAFKKIFLVNQRKFFCINYYITEDNLEIRERDSYVAAETVHLKPVYNSSLFQQFISCNSWLKGYFPNYAEMMNHNCRVNDRPSVFQKLLELPFRLDSATRLDRWIMKKMEYLWKIRYPTLSDHDRRQLFRCEPHISTAHGGDFRTRVMSEYRIRLKSYGLPE